ncbi:MAG: hypothetical protein R6U21_04265 [Thermoplasmatota archaeon]
MRKNVLHSIGIVLSFSLKMLMVGLLIISIFNAQLAWVFGCSFALFLSLIPTILKNNYEIHLPLILDILITLALFLHIGGVLLHAYSAIPHYDTLTHFVSSFIIAFLSFVSIYILDEFWDGLRMDKYAIAFNVVILTVALGVIWELAEWSSDLLFGTYEQWGYNDTIKDLFVDMIAGLVMAVIGLLLMKQGTFRTLTDDLGKGISNRLFKREKR